MNCDRNLIEDFFFLEKFSGCAVRNDFEATLIRPGSVCGSRKQTKFIESKLATVHHSAINHVPCSINSHKYLNVPAEHFSALSAKFCTQKSLFSPSLALFTH